MDFPDYYKILGVARDASADQIKAAYRALARQWHPDTCRGSDKQAAEQKFKAISEAYEVLSDPQQRAKYDAMGAPWRGGAPPPREAPSRTMSPEEFERIFGGRGFSDFFTTFFGDDLASHFGRRPHRHSRFRQQGADVRAQVDVPLLLAVTGGKRGFEIEAKAACTTCGGAGVWEGEHVCPACGGVGSRRQRRSLTVTIPKDVRDGQAIRLRGLGEPGAEGAPAGDMYLTVRIAPDGPYQPQGVDVVADLPVAPWEAALGAKVPVTTPRGEVLLTIPEGSGAGARLRVRGHGLARADGTRGDFHARLVIELPRPLGAQQVEALRRLRETPGPAVRGGARGNGAPPP
jgi:curved DNA-binding protein